MHLTHLLLILQDESGRFRQTKRLNPVRLKARRGDSERLKSALILQYPQFRDAFLSSKLLRDARHEYPDTNSKNTLLRAHRQMIRLRAMDSILHNAQRQGRVSFYLTHTQEEAIQAGAASALESQDVILAQYREAGLLMWRGFTLEQFTNQCFTNDMDLNKGKQMPIHYGSRALNYQTISSPLGTQITQAVGVAYKLKMDAVAYPERDRAISIVFFGDGASSSVDFHSACNFAATLKTPMIFFCRNNGYAISTPTEGESGELHFDVSGPASQLNTSPLPLRQTSTRATASSAALPATAWRPSESTVTTYSPSMPPWQRRGR